MKKGVFTMNNPLVILKDEPKQEVRYQDWRHSHFEGLPNISKLIKTVQSDQFGGRTR